MGNNNSGDCFRTDEYYFFSDTNLRFCERLTLSDHEYINSYSALMISLLGFYNLFFYHHNISLLRFISASLMFNGIISFLNHWNGKREWLFMDNISIAITIYLLLKLSIDEFIENYDYVIITESSAAAINKKYGTGRAASKSTGGTGTIPQELAVQNVLHHTDFVSRPIFRMIGWIFCLFLVFLFIIYNINGCNWHQITNKNMIFIIFILIIPLFIFVLLTLFYFVSKGKQHQLGTVVHSSLMADTAFKCYIRGVIMILIGNILWILTEESCKDNNGWKVFPGILIYHLLTFYGYSMISIYIIFLNNDLERRLSTFQSLHQRKLCIGLIWFHWLFPSIKTVDSKSKEEKADDVPEDSMNIATPTVEPTVPPLGRVVSAL